ncbi:DoxX-like family protein [Paenibacillus sp. D9]|uniref:DoxX-like family protein n=1 Tax=Paenibacillus sp. D9 TaxID=665792 RepID=UPI00067681D5|nr:DoxX-like family protein [Paenibacillus sp. D9]
MSRTGNKSLVGKISVQPIYVEMRMRCGVEELWHLTQQPKLHERWDLRFTSIDFLPQSEGREGRRFRYRTRIGFGAAVEGFGTTKTRPHSAAGRRLSTLRFSSSQKWSLLRSGAGYWQYEETGEGLRFMTRYTYSTRFGTAGKLADRYMFRPLMGWATAWSFDRLRMWAEKGWQPELVAAMAAIHLASITALAGMWLYEGIVPKLLHDSGTELGMLAGLGLTSTAQSLALQLLGWGEAAAAVILVACRHSRAVITIQAACLLLLSVCGAALRPELLAEPFNPLTTTIPLLVLSAAAAIAVPYCPRASRCLRKQPRAKGGRSL